MPYLQHQVGVVVVQVVLLILSELHDVTLVVYPVQHLTLPTELQEMTRVQPVLYIDPVQYKHIGLHVYRNLLWLLRDEGGGSRGMGTYAIPITQRD